MKPSSSISLVAIGASFRPTSSITSSPPSPAESISSRVMWCSWAGPHFHSVYLCRLSTWRNIRCEPMTVVSCSAVRPRYWSASAHLIVDLPHLRSGLTRRSKSISGSSGISGSSRSIRKLNMCVSPFCTTACSGIMPVSLHVMSSLLLRSRSQPPLALVDSSCSSLASARFMPKHAMYEIGVPP